jgi:hypothetical protein
LEMEMTGCTLPRAMPMELGVKSGDGSTGPATQPSSGGVSPQRHRDLACSARAP